MKRFAAFFTNLVVYSVVLVSASNAQPGQNVPFSAIVYPDSAGQSVSVNNLRLDFQFAGYGIYMPNNYPTVAYIPLETGERVKFQYLLEVTFRGKRVEWKQFVESDRRDEFDNIDKDGYRHWTGVEVQTSALDLQRKRINSRIKRPEYADMYLKGSTPRGEFKLKLNQENGKTVRVVFKQSLLLQCVKDTTHVFPNSDWKFCPVCGGILKAIPVPEPAKK